MYLEFALKIIFCSPTYSSSNKEENLIAMLTKSETWRKAPLTIHYTYPIYSDCTSSRKSLSIALGTGFPP